MPPASQLSLVAVLERHRGDAARPAAAAREANQSHRRAPALELLPHVLVGEQLATPVAQPHGVRPARLPAVGVRHSSPGCALQDGHERWRHPRTPCSIREGLLL